MKYYVYVSDTKLDMLYPQIPQAFLKKISAELGINLPFVSLSLKERKDDLQSQQTARYQKLDVVTNYIRNNFSVGSIDNPNEYFEGTLRMRWKNMKQISLVLFGGKTDQTWILLGGSAYHMVGSRRGESDSYSVNSFTWQIFDGLKTIVEAEDPSSIISSKTSYLGFVVNNVSRMTGPEETLQFLARKCDFGKPELPRNTSKDPEIPYKKGDSVLLGTPIYVASAG